MNDANLATLISLIFVGLLGMFIGYAVCLVRVGRENKGLKRDLAWRNEDNLTANAGAQNAS